MPPAAVEATIYRADTPAEALVQAQYYALLQVRQIKLILLWTMVVLPAVVGLALLVLAGQGSSSTAPSYYP